MKLNKLLYGLFITFIAIIICNPCIAQQKQTTQISSGLKIIPPPNGGIYMGQAEFEGETTAFEKAIGRKVSIKADFSVIKGNEESDEHSLSFDLTRARQLWKHGYITYTGAYEAYPGHGSFTVDKLLRGKYDNDLKKLASQFKEFGKPMIFGVAREPNGVLGPYMGGFGPDGNKPVWWAGEKKRGFTEFTPPPGPKGNPELYSGLGSPSICDGIERLAAAHRYYHDFFVRREGINFLTFETMGWGVPVPTDETSTLYKSCNDFSTFYHMISNYVDWVSIDWYMVSETKPEPSNSEYLKRLENLMIEIRRVAPNKPVLLSELGFCGPQKDKKVRIGMKEIITKYPEINAFILWFEDCQIKPNTPEGDAFRQIIEENSGYFHSCVYFSDGSTIPGCESSVYKTYPNTKTKENK